MAAARAVAARAAAADQPTRAARIGRSLCFCIPANQNLLAYWDTVADRLFKIRNSENIQGVVQQLPLFDPPPDPGMLDRTELTKATFNDVYSKLVGEYELPVTDLAYNPLQSAQGSSPSAQAGATGQGHQDQAGIAARTARCIVARPERYRRASFSYLARRYPHPPP